MNKNILTIEELLSLNETMLGRGMPVEEDGVGYNKADYGACANYWYGLSDAQVADLAKRLVKYSTTQLNLDKKIMKETAEYYKNLTTDEFDRTDGVSVNVKENGTLISFRYNETFIEIIQKQPKRQYDRENKQWIVPNGNALKALEDLKEVGADVDNAIEYVKSHPLCQVQEKVKQEKVDILTRFDGEFALLKFNYNKEVLEAIKEINFKDRQWNPQFKFWAIKQNHLDKLKEVLVNVANFKAM